MVTLGVIPSMKKSNFSEISFISSLVSSILLLDSYPPKGFDVLPPLIKIVLILSSLKYSFKVFSRPLPKPNKTMKISIPSATVKPAKNVLNLLFLIVSNISNQRSLLNILKSFFLSYFFILNYDTIF